MENTTSKPHGEFASEVLSLMDILYIGSEIVVGFLTILTNAIVLNAVNSHFKKTNTNLYVINLLVADIVVGINAPISSVVGYYGVPKQFDWCVLMNSSLNVVTNCAILSLVVVAFDRYILITHRSFHKRVLTKRATWVILVFLWIIGTVVGLLTVVPIFHQDRTSFTICSYRAAIHPRYNVYVQLFGFLVPLLVLMLIFYSRIFLFVRSFNQRLRETKGMSPERVGYEMKVFSSLAVIFFVFAVCWLPLQINTAVHYLNPDTTGIPIWLILAFVVLTHANSLFNPLIYGASQTYVRQAVEGNMFSILRCCFSIIPVHPNIFSLPKGVSRYYGMSKTTFNLETLQTPSNFAATDLGRECTSFSGEPSTGDPADTVANDQVPVQTLKTSESTLFDDIRPKICQSSDDVDTGDKVYVKTKGSGHDHYATSDNNPSTITGESSLTDSDAEVTSDDHCLKTSRSSHVDLQINSFKQNDNVVNGNGLVKTNGCADYLNTRNDKASAQIRRCVDKLKNGHVYVGDNDVREKVARSDSVVRDFGLSLVSDADDTTTGDAENVNILSAISQTDFKK